MKQADSHSWDYRVFIVAFWGELHHSLLWPLTGFPSKVKVSDIESPSTELPPNALSYDYWHFVCHLKSALLNLKLWTFRGLFWRAMTLGTFTSTVVNYSHLTHPGLVNCQQKARARERMTQHTYWERDKRRHLSVYQSIPLVESSFIQIFSRSKSSQKKGEKNAPGIEERKQTQICLLWCLAESRPCQNIIDCHEVRSN